MKEIDRLTDDVYDNADINLCAELICDQINNQIGSNSTAVYLYDRILNRHNLVAFIGINRFPEWIPTNFKQKNCFLSYRNNFECGAILIDKSESIIIESMDRIIKLLVLLYNRKFNFEMYANSSRPIDYFQDRKDFYKDLCELTRKSSQMPAGALRIKDEKVLRTAFFWNNWNQKTFSESDWDIEDYDELQPIWKSLITREPVVVSPEEFSYQFFQHQTQIGVQAAIICPLNVGTDTIGTLSFAMPISYEFSDTEKFAFLNLANSVGVSVKNFDQTALFQSNFQDDVRISQVLTAVEIAQAARHSVRANLDTLKTYVEIVRLNLDKGVARSTKDSTSDVISKCTTAFDACFKSLDDIKTAMKPPKRSAEIMSIRQVFERAKNQLRGRLDKYNISANWVDSDAEIECFPDALTQVFLNLLLNSIDAFSLSSKKRDKFFRARIHDNFERAETIKVRIEDNAGGIDVGRLQHAAKDFESKPEELVFAKNVTSKGEEGSGWGLYVSRKIVGDHGGNLRLLEHRGKAVFEVELRRKLRE